MTTDPKSSYRQKRDMMILYQRVFGTPEGKQVLMDILNRNFFLSPTGGDPVNGGKRDAAVEILAMCSKNVIKAYEEYIKGD